MFAVMFISLKRTNIRADLQTATQRINLVPGSITDTSAHTRDSLSPGSTIDQVITRLSLIGQYSYS